MIQVKLTSANPSWPLERQTPGNSGIWGRTKFLVNQPVNSCDFWVVYDDLPQTETVHCPPSGLILITAEPPSIKNYPPGFTAQFSTVITCQKRIHHPNRILHQQSLPWHIGRRQEKHQNISFSKDYDELASMKVIGKQRLISVISSAKINTPGHKKRLSLVNDLSRHFGTRLDVFGRGLNEIEDKWDAVAPYAYHIVLENSSVKDYWTEKLSDCYLAGAFPIYFGCPNVNDYFPREAFLEIPNNSRRAIPLIEAAIENNLFQKSTEALALARRLVLNRYNLFAEASRLCNDLPNREPARDVTLLPRREFIQSNGFGRAVYSVKKVFVKLRRRSR